jgi:hypothetical protein
MRLKAPKTMMYCVSVTLELPRTSTQMACACAHVPAACQCRMHAQHQHDGVLRERHAGVAAHEHADGLRMRACAGSMSARMHSPAPARRWPAGHVPGQHVHPHA